MISEKRKIVIGDIHGNYLGVKSILNQVHYDTVKDLLIFTGDYIDGFYDSRFNPQKTIDLLIKLKKENENVFTLLGNHDLWMQQWIKAGTKFPVGLWWSQGGNGTLASYGIGYDYYISVKDQIPDEHVDFLDKLIPCYVDNYIVVVHGGFGDISDMETAKTGFSYTENILWNRDFWCTSDKRLLDQYNQVFGNRIFICGHTPYGPQISENPSRVLIDSGSKDSGDLCGIVIDQGKTIGVIVRAFPMGKCSSV